MVTKNNDLKLNFFKFHSCRLKFGNYHYEINSIENVDTLFS